jgi:Rod binding domain-containing protein
MSASASDIALGSIGTDAGIPGLNVADIPANVRNGNNTAKQAYTEGLAFENVLVNELSQQLSSTMYGGSGTDAALPGDGSAGSDGGDSSSSGLLSGAGAYASMIPQALTSSIMSGGGMGIAEEFAQEIDPSINAAANADASANGTGGAGQVGI